MKDLLTTSLLTGYGARRTIRNLGALLLLSAGTTHADTPTIAALGDSLTQGYGLIPENGFVPQLQAWLDANGHQVTLINAGVSGDTTAGGLARAGWTLTDEVDGLIVSLGGNDLLRGLDPSGSRANLAGILEIAEQRGVEVLLIGMEAPSNYGADFKAEFDAIYGELSTEYESLLHPDFLRALTRDTDVQTALARYMQADGIHPNAEGVALIVQDIGPSVVDLLERLED